MAAGIPPLFAGIGLNENPPEGVGLLLPKEKVFVLADVLLDEGETPNARGAAGLFSDTEAAKAEFAVVFGGPKAEEEIDACPKIGAGAVVTPKAGAEVDKAPKTEDAVV